MPPKTDKTQATGRPDIHRAAKDLLEACYALHSCILADMAWGKEEPCPDGMVKWNSAEFMRRVHMLDSALSHVDTILNQQVDTMTMTHYPLSVEPKATRQPWAVGNLGSSYGNQFLVVSGGYIVCDTDISDRSSEAGTMPREEMEANARLIVLAVNSFEAMRGLLERLSERHVGGCSAIVCNEEKFCKCGRNEARALLARMEESE